MRFLFVHQNFPGQYLYLLQHLVRAGTHEVMFITEDNGNNIPGVRRVTYRGPPALHDDTHRDAQEFEQAVHRAQLVAAAASQLKTLGFTPDIIIGHHGWGELLNMQDVWPGVPLLGYLEFYYNLHNSDVDFDAEFPTGGVSAHSRVRAKNAVNLLALNNPGAGQTPTLYQHGTYPAWAQAGITVLPEGVNLDQCAPNPAMAGNTLAIGDFTIQPGDKLVTYVARDLEPYRGFHTMMRALPGLLRGRRDVKVVLVGGDSVSYGAQLVGSTWREYFSSQVAPYMDPARVCFPGRVPYDAYLALLQRSDVHVYLTYPFVASWSLREALACGCCVVASDTAPVHEFVQDGVNGVLTSFFDPLTLAAHVLRLLENRDEAARLRAGARAYAERALRLSDTIAGYEALIRRLAG